MAVVQQLVMFNMIHVIWLSGFGLLYITFFYDRVGTVLTAIEM